MKACAVLFLQLPAFSFFRAASPVRYLSIFPSLTNLVLVLKGLLPGSNFLCSGIIERVICGRVGLYNTLLYFYR